MPSRSGLRRLRRGRPDPEIESESGCGLTLGGEGLKTCGGIVVAPQENLTRLTLPNRSPMEPKAGPLCAAAVRGGSGLFFTQNRLRYGTGTGTDT